MHFLSTSHLWSDHTSCPMHSYADNVTLHFPTCFQRRPTIQEVNSSCRDAWHLISLRFPIGQRNLSSVQCFKYLIPQSINLKQPSFFNGTQLRDSYPLFLKKTRLSPSSTINILTHNLNWKLHILCLDRTVSMKLGVLRHLHQFFSSLYLLTQTLPHQSLPLPHVTSLSHVVQIHSLMHC